MDELSYFIFIGIYYITIIIMYNIKVSVQACILENKSPYKYYYIVFTYPAIEINPESHLLYKKVNSSHMIRTDIINNHRLCICIDQ